MTAEEVRESSWDLAHHAILPHAFPESVLRAESPVGQALS